MLHNWILNITRDVGSVLSCYRKSTICCIRREGIGDCLFSTVSAWSYAKKHGLQLAPIWGYRNFSSENNFFAWFDVGSHIGGVPIIKFTTCSRFYLHIIAFPIWKVVCYSVRKLLFPNTKCFSTYSIKQSHADILENKQPFSGRMLLVSRWSNRLDSYSTPEETAQFFDSLSPNKKLLPKINEFYEQNFQGNKVIGVHVRFFPDHCRDHTIRLVVDAVGRARNKPNLSSSRIFLCSDNDNIKRKILGILDGVIHLGYLQDNDQGEVHISKQGTKIGENTVMEFFLLRKCDLLIRPVKSWFSYYDNRYVPEID